MVRDDFSWFFATEWQREKMLREELADQSDSLSYVRARADENARELRKELKNLSGSMESRLSALTTSFLAFVELDSVRQQLGGYPDHARTRRAAANAVDDLLDGGAVEPIDDVRGYWLPPAVNALQPDGGLDAEHAAVARDRDAVASELFFTVARAALRQGEAVVDRLPSLLAPAEDGSWDDKQLMLWAAVLRGAFGPGAMPHLLPLIRQNFEPVEDWPAWARLKAGTAPRDADPAVHAMTWLADALEDVMPPRPVAEETSWRTARPVGHPFSRPSSVHGEGQEPVSPAGEVDEVEPAAEPPQPVSPREGWASTRELLVSLLHEIIADGAREEAALLVRAEQLRQQLADPLSGTDSAPPEEERTPMVDVVRETAVEPQTSPRDRRLIWREIGARLGPWVGVIMDEKPVVKQMIRATGTNVNVTADGPVIAEQRAEERRIQERYAASPMSAHSTLIMVVGAGLAVVAVAMLIVARNPGWLLLLVAGVAFGVWGNQLRREVASAAENTDSAIRAMHLAIDLTMKRQQEADEQALTKHATRTALGERILAALR